MVIYWGFPGDYDFMVTLMGPFQLWPEISVIGTEQTPFIDIYIYRRSNPIDS